MSDLSQITYIIAMLIILIAFISIFILYCYQSFLFKKIRSTEMGLKFTWRNYIPFWKRNKLEELWNYEYNFLLNFIMRTPIYFFFTDLEFEDETLVKLNARRIKVCKFWLLAVGISFLSIPLQEFYVF